MFTVRYKPITKDFKGKSLHGILKACLHIPSLLSGSFDLFDGPSERQNGCGTIIKLDGDGYGDGDGVGMCKRTLMFV